MFGCFDDMPSEIQFARIFANLSQMSSSCQMCDWSRSDIILLIEGGGVTAVEVEELETADRAESRALPIGASMTKSRE